MTAAAASTGSIILDEIASVVGAEATVTLAQRLGGQSVYVPSTFPAGHPVTDAIGPAAAQLLADRFKSNWLVIPIKLRRRAMIRALAAHRPRLRNSEIASRAGATERFVYKVLKEIDENAIPLRRVDDRQIDMFDAPN